MNDYKSQYFLLIRRECSFCYISYTLCGIVASANFSRRRSMCYALWKILRRPIFIFFLRISSWVISDWNHGKVAVYVWVYGMKGREHVKAGIREKYIIISQRRRETIQFSTCTTDRTWGSFTRVLSRISQDSIIYLPRNRDSNSIICTPTKSRHSARSSISRVWRVPLL